MSKINIVLSNVRNLQKLWSASESELLSPLKKHIKGDGLVHYTLLLMTGMDLLGVGGGVHPSPCPERVQGGGAIFHDKAKDY
jgi:hypothetical protein